MRQIFYLLFVAFLLSACGSSTSMNGSWAAPGIQPTNYQKVVVLAMIADEGRRRMVETELVNAFRGRGANAQASHEIFPAGYLNKNTTKEDIQQKLEAAGADGLLTVALLDVKDETYYVPGTTSYAPYPSYGSWGGFYGYYGPTMYDPGHYAQSTNFFLVTNLYDVKSSELVWSGQSKTVDPSNLTNFAKSYSGTVIKELQKSMVIPK